MQEKNLVKAAENDYRLLLSKLSHEIRNPVALINGFLQLLVSNHPDLKDDRYFQQIVESLDYLKNLLDEVSTFNHSHIAHTQELNPYLLLQDIACSSGVILEPKKIFIHLYKDSAIPRIPLDQVKFQQLFYNLIRNASESIEEDGSIDIHISCDGNDVSISVSDTGSGISEEDLPSVFEPFITHKKNGTGLGLSICKEVMNAHNGSISVSSTLGVGTTFFIRFPVA